MTTNNQLTAFRLVRWDDLPTMPIYMDQLLQLVNQMIAPLDLPLVTKTMVNSYVKQHFFSRPTGRRYTRNHVAAVVIISILKADFALPTIGKAILQIRDARQAAARYAQFSRALTRTLRGDTLSDADDQMEQAIQFAAQTVGYHLLTIQALD